MSFKLKYYLHFFFFFLLVQLKAQENNVLIQSDNANTFFKVFINKSELDKNYSNQLLVTNLFSKKKYYLDIHLLNDTLVIKNEFFLLDDGFTHYYKVNKNKVYLSKIIQSSFLDKSSIKNRVKYNSNSNINSSPIIKEKEILIDTSTVTNHFFLDGYEGEIGCNWPMNDDYFNTFYLELKQLRLEDDKISYIKEKLDTSCLLTSQLDKIFTTLEYDDTKLDFGLFIYNRTFDIESFFNVAKQHIKFESHIEEIKKTYVPSTNEILEKIKGNWIFTNYITTPIHAMEINEAEKFINDTIIINKNNIHFKRNYKYEIVKINKIKDYRNYFLTQYKTDSSILKIDKSSLLFEIETNIEEPLFNNWVFNSSNNSLILIKDGVLFELKKTI